MRSQNGQSNQKEVDLSMYLRERGEKLAAPIVAVDLVAINLASASGQAHGLRSRQRLLVKM